LCVVTRGLIIPPPPNAFSQRLFPTPFPNAFSQRLFHPPVHRRELGHRSGTGGCSGAVSGRTGTHTAVWASGPGQQQHGVRLLHPVQLPTPCPQASENVGSGPRANTTHTSTGLGATSASAASAAPAPAAFSDGCTRFQCEPICGCQRPPLATVHCGGNAAATVARHRRRRIYRVRTTAAGWHHHPYRAAGAADSKTGAARGCRLRCATCLEPSNPVT
jgi:hypothetical protein